MRATCLRIGLQQLLHCLTKLGLTPDALDPSRADPHPLEALLQCSLERWLDAASKELGNLGSFLLGGELISTRYTKRANITNLLIEWEEKAKISL